MKYLIIGGLILGFVIFFLWESVSLRVLYVPISFVESSDSIFHQEKRSYESHYLILQEEVFIPNDPLNDSTCLLLLFEFEP